MNEITDTIFELQQIVNEKIGHKKYIVIEDYLRGMEKYKSIHGSYKKYIGKKEYWNKIEERFDCILNTINIKYEKDIYEKNLNRNKNER